MGSLNPENVPKQELDDSGYVQEVRTDEELPPAEANKNSVNLLDLSDDVLLYILQYCSPMDLKALGFTCARLGTLILDRTLWQRVDARGAPTGKNRMRWLLTHALTVHTTSLKLSGYAREAKGCLGFMSGSREESPLQTPPTCPTPEEMHPWNLWNRETMDTELTGPRLLRLCAQALPRYGGGFPYWPEQMRGAGAPPRDAPPEHTGHACPGPQVTLSHAALCRLTSLCSNLTELALEHVVIDCNMTKIGMFPQSLRILSLLGTKCFNLEKPFLYKIQDHLIHLEELEVSECSWVEPACMLPLSKLPRLARLHMRLCPKLTEFVAYASLATRYGFKQLRVLDLRGSPVGDSEVSALGWVPLLEQLYLSPAPGAARDPAHAHFSRDRPPVHREREPWEEQEPEYYRIKYETESWVTEEKSRPTRNRHNEDCAIGSCVVLHQVNPEDSQGPSSSGTAERARERSGSTVKRTSYIIPKNGMRRTMNMYPDNELDEPVEKFLNDLRNENQEATRKRKQEEDSSHAKDEKKRHDEPNSSIVFLNEPSSSNEAVWSTASSSFGHFSDIEIFPNTKESCSNDPCSSKQPSSINEPTSSINEPTSSINIPMLSKNEPTLSINEPTSSIIESTSSINEPASSISDPTSSIYEPTYSINEPTSSINEPVSSITVHRSSINEPTSSINDPVSSINSPTSSISELTTSINEPTPSINEPTSSMNNPFNSELTSNEPSTSEFKVFNSEEITPKNIPTKGSRKQFDPTNCQISRSTLKYSLDDFKKRTEFGPGFKADSSFDSDDGDDGQSLDDDDDDDDDVRPQPKRCRLDDGASTSTSDTKVDEGSSKKISKTKQTDCEKSSVKHKDTGSNLNKEPKSSSTSNKEPNILSTLNKEPNNSSTLSQEPNNSSTSNKEPKSARKEQSPDSSHSSTLNRSLDRGSSSTTLRETNNKTSDKPTNESTSQTKDNQQKTQRFVRFRLNQPPVIIDGCGNQPIRDGCGNPPVVIGGSNAPVVIGGRTPPVVIDGRNPPVVIGGRNPPVVIGGSNPPVVIESQPFVMEGCRNQPPIVIGCGNHHPSIVIGCSNQPPVVVEGCGNRRVVIEGCSHRDNNHNVHNNNDVQQPDWNSRLDMQGLNLEGQRPAPSPGVRSPSHPEPSGSDNRDPNDLTRHRILYVNVGRRRHAMYQISMPEPVDLRTQRPLTAAMNLIYSSHVAPRLEYTSLVTDAAIRRFGRADGENINYVQIGPLGPVQAPYEDPHARPNRSNLRVLSVTGFRHITNYSLTHLSTAAPHLQSIDFTGTRVTEAGVEHFRNFRPDCRVRYGPVDTPKEDSGRPHSR